jgi:hypothetical protein
LEDEEMAPWIWFLTIGVLFFLMMRAGCGAHVTGHDHGDHQDKHPKPIPGGSTEHRDTVEANPNQCLSKGSAPATSRQPHVLGQQQSENSHVH